MNYDDYIPVKAITLKGRFLVAVLRLLYVLRKTLTRKHRSAIWPQHHEDPLKMSLEEALYLGEKYYYKALIHPEIGADTVSHFAQQQLLFTTPLGFKLQNQITIGAGGDLIPYKPVNPDTTKHLWLQAGQFFFDNHIVFANLETVAHTEKPFSAAPEVMLNDMYFNINDACFDIFNGNGQYRGFDVLSTANNHSMDLGEAGILATINFLKKRNIAHCGTATSPAERDVFPILEREGIKVAFLAYTFSLNKEQLPPDKAWLCNHLYLNEPNPDLSLIVQQAKLARARGAQIIVASLHMGCAYQAYPSQHTISNMHAICAQANIDVLLGGHPHHAQPLEVYRHPRTDGHSSQHLIVYSLGDFVAYDIYKWCHLPLLLKLHIGRGHVDGRPHTQVLGFEAKPFYMQRSTKGQLQLVDFEHIKKLAPKSWPKHQRQEIAALADFYDRFVLLPSQQHTLASQQF